MSQIKRIYCCLLVIGLISISIAQADSFRFEKQILVDDYDPTVNIMVTVEILMIRSLEKYDRQLFFKEIIDCNSDPDFFVKVFINSEEFISPIWQNTKYIYSPNWTATLDVPDDIENVSIKIQLWDARDEGYSSDRLCDISWDSGETDDQYDVDLIYSLKSGHWRGDDYLVSGGAMDPSGYGRLNGCDDGTIYDRDRDCELRFNIFQTEADSDKIPYWMEVYAYDTDPLINNTGEDFDDDKVPIEWEWYWGFDPLTAENHRTLDLENDGIDNYEEYLTAQWGSDPFRKDLFIELDQMEEGPNGEINLLPQASKELLYTAYNRQNVVYHLDDGEMGGSEFIPFDEQSNYSELLEIYNNYFLHNDADNWRRGVFHYGVVIHGHTSAAGAMYGPNRFYITSRGHNKKAESIFLDRDEVFASAFMHETGHTLGFWPIPGHSRGMYPWRLKWWIWRPYKSCMNYRYMYFTVDYSDGSRGLRDLDDWGEHRLNLKFFEKEW